MKRLHEGQHVWLCGAHRDGPSRQCTVVTTYAATAELRALDEPLSDRSGQGTEFYLVFEHEDRPVALRGVVDVSDAALRFRATDGVLVAQDAAPLIAGELPIELVATDRPYAEPIQGTTSSYSADGALLGEAGDLTPGEPVHFTFAPAPDLTVTGRGEVLAIDGDRLAVAFMGLDAGVRGRVIAHVIDAKRRLAVRSS